MVCIHVILRHTQKIINATIKIQSWYRSRRIISDNYPVTRHTLIRMYAVKYPPHLLERLPELIIRKLRLQGPYIYRYFNPTPAMRLGKVRTWYQFCKDFDSDLTMEDFNFIGW